MFWKLNNLYKIIYIIIAFSVRLEKYISNIFLQKKCKASAVRTAIGWLKLNLASCVVHL